MFELEKVSFSADKNNVEREALRERQLTPEHDDKEFFLCTLRSKILWDFLIVVISVGPLVEVGIVQNPLFLVVGGLCIIFSIWVLSCFIITFI